ncbi:MAG: hypothetical protein N2D54_06030, partial [Chloroflexota bacterium]
DPIGCLMTEYLFEKFQIKPLIIFRHPLPVISSLVRLSNRPEWQLDSIHLSALNCQPELVNEYFTDGSLSINSYENDALTNASLLWRALNKVLLSQTVKHPDWVVVKHEEFFESPEINLKDLYSALNLPWSKKIEKAIRRFTSDNNHSRGNGEKVQNFKRNSRKMFENSVIKFSREERRKIFDCTQDVALKLFDEASFWLDRDPQMGKY